MNHHEADALGGHIRTFSSRFISLLAPKQEDIVLVDVAHHLATLNRYTGAPEEPFSIAQHSVLVSYLSPPGFELDGLFHDAPEAYGNDINNPLKREPFMEGYRKWESEIMYPAIARKFGLSPEVPPEVKLADRLAYHLEIAMLWNEPLAGQKQVDLFAKHAGLLVPMGWREAKKLFLQRYWELMNRRLG